MNNINNTSNNYKENTTKQHLHDSWGLNKTSRRAIDNQIAYYQQEENYEACKERVRLWALGRKKEKAEYDKLYYNCRKSWGETKGYILTWNLLNISGDVFK
jgi:hypothetical protein